VAVGDETFASPRPTNPGTVMGTVGYMAPEQVRGEPGDQRSDIFAFGVVLYEMLTRRRPFHRDTAAETMTAILREDPAPLSAGTSAPLPPAFERIVQSMGGKGEGAQDFLSYLLFDPEYTGLLMELGYDDTLKSWDRVERFLAGAD
jgi:serine/threonine protein kinase